MALGSIPIPAINFVIRDAETGKVKEEFRTLPAANSYWKGMRFGLQNNYEVYDIRKGIIIPKSK